MGKLIDEDIFKFVKNSVKNVPEKEREWVSDDLLDYIDMTSSNNDDMFFYDMMKAIRFTYEPGTIAYTKEDRRIYLSCPGIIGRNARKWDFTYDHECLHQLWETFDVAKEIQSKGIEYNHELLNIASDCVINDYLRDIRGKTPPDGIIFPENIEEEFGVKYDRKNDTQFSLYVKLLNTGKKPSSKMMKSIESNGKGGQGQSSSGSQGSSKGSQGGQSGQSGQYKDIDKMSKDEAKASAEADAQRAQEAADRAKDKYGAGSDEAKKAQKAADKAKDAAEKAKNAKNEKDARKAAKEAEQAANEAEKAAEETGENREDKNNKNARKHNQSGGNWGSGVYLGGDEADTDLDDLERRRIADITADIKDTVKKYANKISGEFGKFVKKCKVSKELRESGLAVDALKARSNWKQSTYKAIDAYINNLVFQKKREWKRTYTRPKRGSGIIKFGEPIEMGRIPKEDKLDIPIAFYIDKSGSMTSTISDASKAMYGIAQDIKKRWFSDKIINDMEFSFFAFDTSMHTLKVGQVPRAYDDNMSLADILKFIATRPKKDLINIIITDGQYEIHENEMDSYFKDYDGMMVMVINNVNRKMQDLEKRFRGKFIYVQADREFTV